MESLLRPVTDTLSRDGQAFFHVSQRRLIQYLIPSFVQTFSEGAKLSGGH